MDIWLAFAFISEGKVKNVACFLYTGYTEANMVAKVFCSDENAIAVNVTHIPVQIDDDYIDGVFYRNGEIINPLPSVEQQTEQNTADIASANDAIDELILAITPMEV